MSNRKEYTVEVKEYGMQFSTGLMGALCNGAVTMRVGDTVVFVSAVAATSLKPDQTFFPLTVDYREKFSAAGRFPGGFFKREGRPSEKEVLTSRLCDRPLRPLFPKGFMYEVQVIGLLLATDLTNESDILMVNGASAALMISDIPWVGPIACVRIGEIDGQFIINPTNEQNFESTLDLVYVGNEHEMMMIEGSADQLPESRFIEALEFAHKAIQPIIAAQKEFAALAGKKKKDFALVQVDEKVLDTCNRTVGERLMSTVFQDKKQERGAAVEALKEEAKTALIAQLGEEAFEGYQLNLAFEQMQEKLYRENILHHGKRVDGRKVDELRPISCQTNVLPRVHGSALFQRGETQALAITTLGTSQDAQGLDSLTGGAESKSFLLHYNFPPFSVGETGRFGAASRREIGHGALAERSLLPAVPPEDEFAYAVRIVSEVMESNGSTSMASVCAGCLSLMDAGVPIVAPVAGISTGLIAERDAAGKISKYVILTDILGAEDHFGDMDFKIAGTEDGITGLQLDLKIQGIPLNIAKEAIAQTNIARKKILAIMREVMPAPRSELKETAPRIHQMMIDPEKIGALIGPGGKSIKRIVEVSGAQIDIHESNSGKVLVYASSKESMERAIREVELATGSIESGKTYRGIVRGIKEFGVFVECLPGQEGLVHVSELADCRVNHPEDVCKLGDELIVKCVGIDDKGRIRLSRKAVLCEAQGKPYTPPAEQPARDRSRGPSNGGDRQRRRF